MSHQHAFLSWLRAPPTKAGGVTPRPRGTLILAGSVFLLVACMGAATSYWLPQRDTARPAHTRSQDSALARLEDYTRTIAPKDTAPAPEKPLADVNTMIDRLAARLENAPGDAKGWRMLGWSYFNTGRFQQAALAYARAVALDPNSAELKDAYEEAKAKASGDDRAAPAMPLETGADDKHGTGPTADQAAAYDAMPASDRDAAIRAMVDGLASRLESAPRDADGWTRLMRSRIVLGEKDVAAAAFRRALDIFKDDEATAQKITAAASELGLSTE